MNETSKLTPMLKQYYELKALAPDSILFFRMGDFYEIFGTDAEEVAPKLDVVLTAREKGDQTKIPFCGVPHHAATGYWLKLIKLGYKVSIVEQLEDPAVAKGLVKRGIVRTYTPGSIDELEGLDRDIPNYIFAYLEVPGKSKFAVSICDVSTGELRLGMIEAGELYPTIRRMRPKEILTRRYLVDTLRQNTLDFIEDFGVRIEQMPESPIKDLELQKSIIKKVFSQNSVQTVGSQTIECGDALISSLIQYLWGLQSSTEQFHRVDPLTRQSSMLLSETVVRDLEFFESSKRRMAEGSLFKVIDRTLTPMGARLLRQSMSQPFCKIEDILDRQSAVDILFKQHEGDCAKFRDALNGIADVSRLSARISTGTVRPPELAAIRNALRKSNRIIEMLEPISKNSSHLSGVLGGLNHSTDILIQLEQALEETPGILGTGRGVFRHGFDQILDEKVGLTTSGESRVAKYEEHLKRETGISSLKIKEHKTFGLLIEVTKSNFGKVPSTFIRRQTMVNCERYSTIDLNQLDEELQSASATIIIRESELYQEFVRSLSPVRESLVLFAKAIAELDLIQSFAWIAMRENWSRPQLTDTGPRNLKILGGRHPVVEKFVGRQNFAANDVEMNEKKSHLLITGPNMAGKSTVMRQTAIIAILAQMGSFVPASSAILPVFDRVFTRVGASDDLSRGQSTFMVEMIEASEILRQASPKSLVILDEVGRGTSTGDGLAIAAAILEDLCDRVKCFSLFATHFHELVPMMANRENIGAVQTEVIEGESRQIRFTHKLIFGAAGSSFGIEVATLGGIPSKVIERAREILQVGSTIESQFLRPTSVRKETESVPASIPKDDEALVRDKKQSEKISKIQRDLFGLGGNGGVGNVVQNEPQLNNTLHLERVVARLEAVKIHKTTPLQALNILDELKQLMMPLKQKSLFGDEGRTQAHEN
ncbi:MAG: DNA mismatch repair protein MutS [Proteobacteria bacterium]|nr:DNA mismatch repair protein MutS [Pseudomonadota bacterium]